MKRLIYIIFFLPIMSAAQDKTHVGAFQFDSLKAKKILLDATAVNPDTTIYKLAAFNSSGKIVKFYYYPPLSTSGYTALSQFIGETAWSVYYADGSGDIQRLALGSSGKVLTTNGASSAPTWETPTTGTVTSVSAGFGTAFTTITSTGSVIVDTTSGGVLSWVRGKKLADSLGALIATPTLQQVTTAGNTSTNTITVNQVNSSNAKRVELNAFALSGYAALAIQNKNGSLYLQDSSGSTTSYEMERIRNKFNNQLWLPDGTGTDTLATKADVRAGGGSGYTNLTQFVAQNNWKTFYSDGSGDVQELSNGTSGYVLTSNGTISAPSWQAASTSWGGHFTGTAETVGTPVTLASFPVDINTDAGAVVYTLPTIASSTGNAYFVKNAGGSTLTVQRSSSDQIWTTSAVTSEVLQPGESRMYLAATAYWYSNFIGGIGYQPLDADLTYLAGFTPTANVKTILNAADYAAVKTALSLTIGTNVQAWDADLDSYAGATPASGITTWLATPSSANLRSALTDESGTGAALFNNTPSLIITSTAVTASGNAATVAVTASLTTVTNNSAATLTITMTTASAVDGQISTVRILDFSGVAQTIAWVNTENSSIAAPTTSNGSTTLFLTVKFIYNSATSKWRCIGYA